MSQVARAYQKPSGVWAIEFEANGKRRRISTGIKTAKKKKGARPPPEVKACILPVLRDHW